MSPRNFNHNNPSEIIIKKIIIIDTAGSKRELINYSVVVVNCFLFFTLIFISIAIKSGIK